MVQTEGGYLGTVRKPGLRGHGRVEPVQPLGDGNEGLAATGQGTHRLPQPTRHSIIHVQPAGSIWCCPLLQTSTPGYFLQDFVDMLCNQKLHQSWELLFHHSVVIICFSLTVLVHQYIGFALVALLVEINSIFLHLRQILLMANLVHSTCYRLNSIINLATYIVFRITTLAWMTRWLVLNRENIPLATYTVGTVGMAIMTPMNIILFYRLLRSDFLKSSREAWREKEK
ncbi:TLC domain-containing protein 2 isoform X2 [Mauremys reevesii]|uniref:TLC domain-containing protein 2 isoform X2 n=1 Tax=Mauremys reevesii TaxID=260615 RepID=UPI00193EC3D9|nr:TLC domain-containing protein 2 isoform X2 [Mauremys reevesii]